MNLSGTNGAPEVSGRVGDDGTGWEAGQHRGGQGHGGAGSAGRQQAAGTR